MERSSSKAVPGDRLAPSRGENRRQAILLAIEELLAEESIEALSVGQIAERAGITRSRFYFYFDSKYTALAVVLADAWVGMGELVRQVLAGPGELDLEEYLRDIITNVLEGWCAHAALYVAFFDGRSRDQLLAEMWNRWLDEFADGTSKMLRREVELDRARPAYPDLELLVASLLGLVQFTVYETCRKPSNAADIRHAADVLTAIWLATAWGIGVVDQSPIARGDGPDSRKD